MGKKSKQILGEIDDGVVIDHIPIKAVWEVAKILRVDKEDPGKIHLGDGYDSIQTIGGRKGMLKIQGRNLDDYEFDLIALVAPDATVNIIKNRRVVRKIKVRIPEKLENLIYCHNSRCITNNEREQKHGLKSVVLYDSNTKQFRCYYCEHSFYREDVRLKFD